MMVEVGDHNDDGYGGGDGDHDPDDDDGDDDDDDGEDYDGDDGHDDGDDDDDDECNCVCYYLQYYCSRMPTISGIHPSYMEHRDAHSGGQNRFSAHSLFGLTFQKIIYHQQFSKRLLGPFAGIFPKLMTKTKFSCRVSLKKLHSKNEFRPWQDGTFVDHSQTSLSYTDFIEKAVDGVR